MTDRKDPYAPPPMHHDRSGKLLRVIIMAALLAGGAVWGYTALSGRDESAGLVAPAEKARMADQGYRAAPSEPQTATP